MTVKLRASCRGNLLTSVAQMLKDRNAIAEHQSYLAQRGEVLRRVSVDCNQVGPRPWNKHAESARLAAGPASSPGQRFQNVQRRPSTDRRQQLCPDQQVVIVGERFSPTAVVDRNYKLRCRVRSRPWWRSIS